MTKYYSDTGFYPNYQEIAEAVILNAINRAIMQNNVMKMIINF